MTTTENLNPYKLPTIDRPCPHWCEMPHGHGWDSGHEGVDDSRGHGLTIGKVDGCSVSVDLGNFETSINGGPSSFSPVVITVDSPPRGSDLTAVQAKDLADLLNMAAEKVQSL